MLEKPTLKSTWIPLGLTAIALIVLNLGLYTRLSAQPRAVTLSLPYSTDFVDADVSSYSPFGGDWEVHDETLVQLSTSGSDLGTIIPLKISEDQPYRFETSLRFLGGVSGGGILFNAQQTTSRQQSHMTRFNVDTGKVWLIYGYFGDDSNFMGQGSVSLEISPGDANEHQMSVQVAQDTYSLSVDGQVVATDIPLQYQGGSVGLITSAAQVAFDNVAVEAITDQSDPESGVTEAGAQSTPVPVINATPLIAATQVASIGESIFQDTFEGSTGESAWKFFGGDWQFESGALIQKQTDGFDFGAGYAQPVSAPYHLRVSLRHQTGTGGGVLFNMTNPDSKNGTVMVRYVEDGSFIAWGYFDDNGVFQGQGSVEVPKPETNSHTFDIRVEANTYTISLDGALMAEAQPLQKPLSSSFIGLITSQSAVAFEEVEVFADESAATLTQPEAVSANVTNAADIDLANATGDWVITENSIRQSATEATDYIAGTGLAAMTFTLSVDILLPTDLPDAGAGLVFHMAEASKPNSGYMVRFSEGGKGIFWGSYNAEGVFEGQGGTQLALTANEPHTLTITAGNQSFNVSVDGTSVAQNIPLEQKTGWIGLVSFRGPVEFSNIQLTLGE